MNKRLLTGQILLNVSTILIVALMLFAYRAWAAPAEVAPPAVVVAEATAAPQIPLLDAANTSTVVNATPGVITYQATLTDASGKPINATLAIVFRLYATPTGGTALWTETRSGANAVPVQNGLLNVALGSLTPIPNSVWDNSPLYLEVKIGNDPAMSPRELIGMVSEAAMASRASTDFKVPGILTVQGGANISSASPGPFIGTGPDLGEYTIGDYTGHLYQVLGVQRSPQATAGKSDTGAGGFGIVSGDNQAAPVVWLYGFGGRNEFRVLRRYYGTDIANDAVLFAVDVSGNGKFSGNLIVDGSSLVHNGADFIMGPVTGRGDGGRALVHDVGDTLVINYANDFAGGVVVNGLRTGKIIEENLMTPAQRTNSELLNFSEGDVLCWNAENSALQLCSEHAASLVVAVSDAQGMPVIQGVEPIKVIGPVQVGDLLVASDRAGYAVTWPSQEQGNPPTGTVIAKALELLTTDEGIILAFIMVR